MALLVRAFYNHVINIVQLLLRGGSIQSFGFSSSAWFWVKKLPEISHLDGFAHLHHHLISAWAGTKISVEKFKKAWGMSYSNYN